MLDWIGLSCYSRDAAVEKAGEAREGLKPSFDTPDSFVFQCRKGRRSPSGIET